jgi:hypothetical protein
MARSFSQPAVLGGGGSRVRKTEGGIFSLCTRRVICPAGIWTAGAAGINAAEGDAGWQQEQHSPLQCCGGQPSSSCSSAADAIIEPTLETAVRSRDCDQSAWLAWPSARKKSVATLSKASSRSILASSLSVSAFYPWESWMSEAGTSGLLFAHQCSQAYACQPMLVQIVRNVQYSRA